MDEHAAGLARAANLKLEKLGPRLFEKPSKLWKEQNGLLMSKITGRLGQDASNVRKAGGEAVRLCGDSNFRKCVLVGPVSWRYAFFFMRERCCGGIDSMHSAS